MKTLIIFYSRTGITRQLAGRLATAFDADIAEIRCDRYGPGPLRYLLAGYNSVKGNIPRVDVPAEAPLALTGRRLDTDEAARAIRTYVNDLGGSS